MIDIINTFFRNVPAFRTYEANINTMPCMLNLLRTPNNYTPVATLVFSSVSLVIEYSFDDFFGRKTDTKTFPSLFLLYL